MGFRVWGLGFRGLLGILLGLGFRVWGSGFLGLWFRGLLGILLGLGFRAVLLRGFRDLYGFRGSRPSGALCFWFLGLGLLGLGFRV